MRYVWADKDFYAVALPFFFIVGVYCGSATILWLFVVEMQDCRIVCLQCGLFLCWRIYCLILRFIGFKFGDNP